MTGMQSFASQAADLSHRGEEFRQMSANVAIPTTTEYSGFYPPPICSDVDHKGSEIARSLAYTASDTVPSASLSFHLPEFKHTPTFDVTGMPPNTTEQLRPTKFANEAETGYTGLHELICTSAEVMTLDMEINNTESQQHHTLKQEPPDIPVSGNPTPVPIITKTEPHSHLPKVCSYAYIIQLDIIIIEHYINF